MKRKDAELEILKRIVDRNKIKNTGISIDSTVSVLIQNNVSLHPSKTTGEF